MKDINEINIEENDWAVVNPETGEIVNKLSEGDKIVRKEQSEYQQQYVINFNKGKSFVKLYDETLEILSERLTPTEFLLVVRLAKHVSYKDSILRYNGKIMTMQDISDTLKIDYGTIRRLIPSLVRKGILGIHKTGCAENPKLLIKAITCNPYIYVRGNDISKMAIGLFEKSGWDKILSANKRE